MLKEYKLGNTIYEIATVKSKIIAVLGEINE
jgi:hypothetical protein